MGSDESHFNVSVGSDRQSHKTVSTNHNLSEEKRKAEAESTRGRLLVTWCLTSTETIRFITDAEKVGRGMEVGGEGAYIPVATCRYAVT